MANILLNGLAAKTGGGKSILNNYLALLKKSDSKHSYFVLTPKKQEYDKYACDFIRIIDIYRLFKNNAVYPLLYHVVFPRLLRSYKIDIIFNMGDIVIPTSVAQLYLFDWPYAAYPDSVVWKRMDLMSLLARKVKFFEFKRYIKRATTAIAQTPTMKKKLESLYGLNNVEIVPNAVSLENMTGGKAFDFNLPHDKIKLFYLTYYYPHKNLEVFLPLARKIKEKSLPYCIVVTLDSSQHVKAKIFLNDIRSEGLDDVIANVGPVSMDAVPSLYSQCDALLMPTLLESFLGTYVEAMFHGKTILTSDLDFAGDVCGRAAFYFDPLDADSILSAINLAFGDESQRMMKIEEGKYQLSQLLSWEQAFEKYQALLEREIGKWTFT